GSKQRGTGDSSAAASAVMKRGAWIFFLAFLFRIQAWALGLGPPRTLLKVDILNIMGPSIVAAGALWGALQIPRQRLAAFTSTAVAIALLTPIVRGTPMLDGLPDPLEAYLRPVRGLSSFCLFPWAGFVFAGGVVGVLLADSRTSER